jgi:hypothetical protein
MSLSVFEALMLLCFGASWPFSIYKSWKTREVGSKSLVFLVLVLVGYAAGITHKLLYSPDLVLSLYILNFLMVATDIALYVRNTRAKG